MSEITFTDRESEYLNCNVPLLTTGEKVRGLTVGFLIGLLQAAFTPGNSKGNQKLLSTSRLMRYTKYKKAVLRKRDGTPKKRDEKLLRKLNKKPFVLDPDTYDPDEFTKKLYDAYMEKLERNETNDR